MALEVMPQASTSVVLAQVLVLRLGLGLGVLAGGGDRRED